MPSFRLLHASDLHFARVPWQVGLPDMRYVWVSGIGGTLAPVSSHNPRIAEAFVAFAHANRDRLDVIVLSPVGKGISMSGPRLRKGFPCPGS
jgi:hypothetical protein